MLLMAVLIAAKLHRAGGEVLSPIAASLARSSRVGAAQTGPSGRPTRQCRPAPSADCRPTRLRDAGVGSSNLPTRHHREGLTTGPLAASRRRCPRRVDWRPSRGGGENNLAPMAAALRSRAQHGRRPRPHQQPRHRNPGGQDPAFRSARFGSEGLKDQGATARPASGLRAGASGARPRPRMMSCPLGAGPQVGGSRTTVRKNSSILRIASRKLWWSVGLVT
jgi:hypothetical protein